MADSLATEGIHQVQAGGYVVSIGASTRHDYATLIQEAAPAHHFAVISDSNVAPLYASPLRAALARRGRATLHQLPAGEQHKTRESWATLSDALVEAGCGRDTTVVALGGGVVGDLAGFVAATYMRGIPVVQCPTSLLAMIDASVGGKTGVDTFHGKNLIGAFHPPAAVLIDVETVQSLPPEHRRAGLAEAIKHGVVADAGYLAWLDAALPALLAADAAALVECVTRSVEIKSAVVTADPRERGLRRVLNFGHTVGHALELASGFTLLHGDAIAIGMVLEARLAERVGVGRVGLAADVEAVIRRAGLPSSRPAALSADRIVEGTRMDKKARGGAVTYSLPSDIGTMAGADRGWGIDVPEALLREVLA